MIKKNNVYRVNSALVIKANGFKLVIMRVNDYFGIEEISDKYILVKTNSGSFIELSEEWILKNCEEVK